MKKEHKEEKQERHRRGSPKAKKHKQEDRSRSRDRRQAREPEYRGNRNEKKEHPMWDKDDEDERGQRIPKYHLKMGASKFLAMLNKQEAERIRSLWAEQSPKNLTLEQLQRAFMEAAKMIGDREFKAAEHRWQNCKGTWSEKELSSMVATKLDDERSLQNEPIREFVTLERQWMLKLLKEGERFKSEQGRGDIDLRFHEMSRKMEELKKDADKWKNEAESARRATAKTAEMTKRLIKEQSQANRMLESERKKAEQAKLKLKQESSTSGGASDQMERGGRQERRAVDADREKDPHGKQDRHPA